jgi:hypothetical protein
VVCPLFRLRLNRGLSPISPGLARAPASYTGIRALPRTAGRSIHLPQTQEIRMPNIPPVPFDKVPPFLQNIMHAYDEELGGSGFVQVFAHAPEVFKKFIDFYFELELETRGAIDGVITELARLMVARQNGCSL